MATLAVALADPADGEPAARVALAVGARVDKATGFGWVRIIEARWRSVGDRTHQLGLPLTRQERGPGCVATRMCAADMSQPAGLREALAVASVRAGWTSGHTQLAVIEGFAEHQSGQTFAPYAYVSVNGFSV